MHDEQAHQARKVTELTRWALVTLQNVERGLLPVKALRGVVDPAVISALGPIKPPKPGQPIFEPHVARVRVHLVNQTLAHVAAVAPRPDGRMAGYVLELHHDTVTRQWKIAELSRAEERRIVGPEQRMPLADQGVRRLPVDLTPLIAMTDCARQEALSHVDAAQAQLDALRDTLTATRPGATRRSRERAAMREKEQAARRDLERWHRKVRELDNELTELRDVRELREVRSMVEQRDPLMAVRGQPTHLEQLLGPIPRDRDERAQWRRAASEVEAYRQRWEITDPEQALAPLPPNAPTEQTADRAAARGAAEQYVTLREASRERDAEPVVVSL